MERIQIDAIYLPQTTDGFKAVFMATDHFSKMSWCVAAKSKHHTWTLALLQQIIDVNVNIGVAKEKVFTTVQSDNGGEFIADEVKKFVENHGGKLIHGRPYHPQSQGCQERAGGTLKKYLACELYAHGGSWVAHLAPTLAKHLSLKHETLRCSPLEVWSDCWVKLYSAASYKKFKTIKLKLLRVMLNVISNVFQRVKPMSKISVKELKLWSEIIEKNKKLILPIHIVQWCYKFLRKVKLVKSSG
jgi:hypothetical protein